MEVENVNVLVKSLSNQNTVEFHVVLFWILKTATPNHAQLTALWPNGPNGKFVTRAVVVVNKNDHDPSLFNRPLEELYALKPKMYVNAMLSHAPSTVCCLTGLHGVYVTKPAVEETDSETELSLSKINSVVNHVVD